MPTATFVNYYDILEVAPTASDEKLKEAIKQARRTWVKRQNHPNADRRREAEDRVKQIDEAEKILLNGQRQKFDQDLANYRAPAPETGPSLDGSSDWLQRAYDFLSRGDASSAAYAARQATEQHGANHEAWAVRARSSFLIGREQDAVFEFNEAIRIKPEADEYHFDLGSVYEAHAQWKSALDCYERAASLQPGQPLYRVAVASVYLNNDMPAKALPMLEEVHKAHPDVESFNFYLAWALHDTTLEKWTKLKNGTFVITTPEQIALTRKNLERANALKFDDADARHEIRDTLKLADDAEKMVFRLPGVSAVGMADGCGQAAFIFALVIGFWISIPMIGFAIHPILGIPVTAAWGYLFKNVAWKPQWKRTAKDTQGMRASN